MVIATSEPFVTDWVAEVERQAKRSVRLVVANPLEIAKYTAEFLRWPNPSGRRSSRAAPRARPALSSWWS